ncbi:type I secretion system permease/ATPase [Enterobacter roggenkampii]|uniref:type I secretion system permease/ATPase n=1 Tax=Enterobacter roggenkampii TaxID=1812935 RepID=UPI0032AE8176
MVFSQFCSGLVIAAKELGINVSEENLAHLVKHSEDLPSLFENMADYIGLQHQQCQSQISTLPESMFPICVPLRQGRMAVIYGVEGENAHLTYSEAGKIRVVERLSDIESEREGAYWIVKRRVMARRGRNIVKDFSKTNSWLWQLIRQDLRFYLLITISALFGNILTLVSSLFSMQVYDRVIPAQSFPTLWVLFGGVIIALLCDMLLRMARSRLADAIGKRADIHMSSFFYSRALEIKNSARPNSTGAFIAQIREIEHIRELLTSTTVLAIVDIPFITLFLALIWSIGGWLVLPAMLAIPLIIIPGLLLQFPLARLSKKGHEESAQRNALLVETVQGLEDIKLTQSEERFRRLWRHCISTASQVSLEQRHWSYLLSNWCQFVQQTVYAGVIALGVYLVIDNTITTGTLVGCSILSSRTVGPLGQIAGILTRLQQAKTSLQGLNGFLERPLEQRDFDDVSHNENIRGNYRLSHARFRFMPESRWVIDIAELNIQAGEKVAILGTIGAGKSTLLRVLSGMADSAEGEITLDGIAINNLSVNDMRYGVGYLQQDAQLFWGTVRDNILLGNPHATAEEIIHILNMAGAAGVLRNEHGLDLPIAEGGKGLSGGQRQALLLARTLIRNSNVLLLDEPTASMDENSELHVITQLEKHCQDKTLIMVTHRQAPLRLVDRIIVLDQGKIALDGPRDQIMHQLQASRRAVAA